MDPTEQKQRLQDLKRENRLEDIQLKLAREVAELLRVAVYNAWGYDTTIEITVRKGDMEEKL